MSPIYPAPADGVIYETDDGHGIVVEDGRIRMVDPASASVASVPVPANPLDRRAIVVNLATALGFDAPSLRPNLDVGDRVVDYSDGTPVSGHVAAVEDPYVWILRDGDDGIPATVHSRHVVLEERATGTEPDESEAVVELEWIVTFDPLEVAAALDDGRIVQMEMSSGGWTDTPVSADTLRGFEGHARRIVAHRYEGPPVDVVCTPEHRTCTDDDWCGDADPDSELICSRPPGHVGPHVACVPAGEHTLETWPETDP